jgi:hypothetical protein
MDSEAKKKPYQDKDALKGKHYPYSGLHLSGHQNLRKVALSYHNKA